MNIVGPIPPHVLRLMNPEDRPKGVAGMTTEEVIESNRVKSEKELQEQVANLLRVNDIAFFCSRMDRRTTGTVGWPDFTFAVKSIACAFECKLPGQELRDEQVATISAMGKNGWNVRIIRSLKEASEALREWSR